MLSVNQSCADPDLDSQLQCVTYDGTLDNMGTVKHSLLTCGCYFLSVCLHILDSVFFSCIVGVHVGLRVCLAIYVPLEMKML